VTKNGTTNVSVSSVAVDTTAKTVTLTLASAVTNADAVTVSYTAGTNKVQDIAGNPAANLSSQTATNNSGDTTAPAVPTVALTSGSDSGTSNSDAKTNVTTPTIRVTLNGTGATAPVVGDVVKLYDGATQVGTATLTGTDITNGYVDVTSSARTAGALSFTATVTDAANNTSSASSAVAVTLDTIAPSLSSAAVNGSTLVLTYTEAGVGFAGTTPAASDFTVTKNGSTNVSVSSVAVDTTAKTVTLTLASAVTNADAVTVSYTAGTNKVQDIAGNTAANLLGQTATNNSSDTTAPAVPTVALTSGSDSGTSNSDAKTNVTTPTIRVTLNGTGATAPVAGDVVKLYDGATQVGTATLTGTDITNGYVDVTSSARTAGSLSFTATVTDAANNTSSASNAVAVTLDTTAPSLNTAAVNGSTLVLTYTEAGVGIASTTPAASDFTVTKNGTTNVSVSSVAVDTTAKTVTLTLASAVTNADAVTVSYTAGTNKVQDIAGNTAANLSGQTATNNSGDTTAPAAPTAALTSGSDSGTSNSDAKTNVTTPTIRVTLNGTGATAPVVGDVVKLYDGATQVGTATLTGTDITNGYVDVTSSARTAGSLSFTATVTDAANNTSSASSAVAVTLDTTAPSLNTAAVSGSTLVLTYTEAGVGFAGTTPAASDFTVTKNGTTPIAVTNVAIDVATKTVTLTLASGITNTDSATISYASGRSKLQDVAGNTAANLSGQVVTNLASTPKITGPSGGAGDATSAKTIFENSTAVAVLSADTAVTWSLVGGTEQAKFTINPTTGTLAFAAAPDFEAPTDGDVNNTYVVVVKATDASGNSATQTVTVTVANVNEAPVASAVPNQSATVGSAITPVVVPAFTDPENDPLTYAATLSDGSALPTWLSFNPTTRTFSGLPPAGTVPGTLSVKVTGSDGSLNSAATFAITVVSPSAPAAAADATNATEAGGVSNGTAGVDPSGNVLANDSGTGIKVTAAQVGATLTGGASAVAIGSPATIVGGFGSLVIGADGAYTYTVNNVSSAVQALNVGGTLTDTFSYRVTDQAGQTTTATLTITVRGANDAPVPSTVAVSAATIGSAMAPIVVPAFTDVDNAALTYTATLTDGSPLPSWLSFDSTTRTFSGTPPAGATPGTLAVKVTGSDGAAASSVIFAVSVANPPAPVAGVDTAAATEASGTGNATPGVNPSGNLLANDSGAAIKVTSMQGSAVAGTDSTVVAGAYGTLTIAADGSYAYAVANANAAVESLNAGGTLVDTFTYRITDQAGQTATATLSVTVRGANDAPVAPSLPAVNATIGAALPAVTIPAFTDIDNSALTYTATLTDGSALPAWLHFDAATRTLSGTPPAGTTAGTLSIAISATDGVATTSGHVSLTLANPSAPTASADTGAATEAGGTANGTAGTNASGNVLSNDTGTKLSVTSAQGSSGSAAPVATAVATTINGQYGVLVIAADGSYTYAVDNHNPAVDALNAGGTLTDTFTYRATDQAGQSSATTLTITIKGANDAAVAPTMPSGGTAIVGSAITPVTVPAFTDVDNGTLTYAATLADGSALPGWLKFDPTTRTFTGTPPAGTAPGSLAIKVSASDGSLTSSATLNLTVALPAIPVANADTVNATEAGGVNNATPGTNPSGNVLTNDTGVKLSVTAVQPAAGSPSAVANGGTSTAAGAYGTLSMAADGSYSYTVDNANAAVDGLNAGDTLTDSFTYQTTDQAGQTATAVLRVTINGTTDVPPPTVPPSNPVPPPSTTPTAPTSTTPTASTAPVTPTPGDLTASLGGSSGSATSSSGSTASDPSGSSATTDVAIDRVSSPAPTIKAGSDSSAGSGGRSAGDGIARYTEPTNAGSATFGVVVIPSDVPNLMIYRGVPDQFCEANSAISFTIPTDAFAHTRAGAQVMLTATLTDGSRLPDWLLFNKISGTFQGVPPKNFSGELRIKVVAVDQQGLQAEAIFRFNIGGAKPSAGNRTRFSDQVRRLAYLNSSPRGLLASTPVHGAR
jgi:uncharacterized repeat protein (TIGR02059 family)